MWNDNRLHRFYSLHWSPAVPSNAQKLPHRYSISQHPHTLLLKVCFQSFHTHYSSLQLPLHPNRNNKKVGHGGGTSNRAEWICQNRTGRGEREQLRGAAAVLLSLTGYCREFTITTVYRQRLKMFYQSLPDEHCADILLLCC